MPLSYTIDNLLKKDKSQEDSGVKTNDISVDSSFSDTENQSDDEQCTSSTSIRKYDRRYKSNVPEDMRLRVNYRERQRMHDLNSALDSLRQALPYSQEPSVKKVSKMSTLILARNYILMLNKSLNEMRKLVRDMTSRQMPIGHLQSSVSPELVHAFPPSFTPISSSQTSPSALFAIDRQCFNSGSNMQPILLPYNIVPSMHHVASHGPMSPYRPCTFCQVSLVSLSKHARKETCSCRAKMGTVTSGNALPLHV